MILKRCGTLLRLTANSKVALSVRFLNLQEYQSKQLLQEHGLNIQRFITVSSGQDASAGLKNFKADEYVVKAQILAGGRGKGTFSSGLQGGVKLTRKNDEVVSLVDQMIGHKLVTKQTPPGGVEVQKVMIAEAVDIQRETYLAILMDRDALGPLIVASPAGGVDIEEVAAKTPHLIHKVPVDINKGLSKASAVDLATKLEFKGDAINKAAEQIIKLYEMFLKVDATQVEINPFGETTKNDVLCFDAKFNFDDSAEFRQERIFAMDDMSEVDPREKAALKAKLNYIQMDGNIACLVNGAGLAMATMDIIKLHGGEPANFLDVGGGVGETQVVEAFRIITSDPKVKAILVNIFGGIVNCAIIANGLTNAFKKLHLSVPLVVRLEGTNVAAAREILKTSGLPIRTAGDLDNAAQLAVQAITA